jgi:FKBP-type peptidyl-prolyl cis-trans isomerase SlyD
MSLLAIQPNSHVVLDYTLKNPEGEVLDASEPLPGVEGEHDGEPIRYVHGYGMLVPGLEVALVGLKVGDKKMIVVSAEEGFGDRDDELVLEIERSEFPDPAKVKVGDEFVAESPEGDELVMRVVEVKGDSVMVDANHPLAGIVLHYDVHVREVRDATEEEVEQAATEFEEARAHVHGPDCDHDHGPDGEDIGLISLGKKAQNLVN